MIRRAVKAMASGQSSRKEKMAMLQRNVPKHMSNHSGIRTKTEAPRLLARVFRVGFDQLEKFIHTFR